MPNNLKIDMNGNGLKIAIVSARFNEIVTRQLMLGLSLIHISAHTRRYAI